MNNLTVSSAVGATDKELISILIKKQKELQEQQKKYVNSLVDITVQVIGSIWPNSIQYNTDKPVANLNIFLHHILKHSRTTHSTLQLAIFYLFRARSNIQKRLNSDIYVSCGRRMFLASLVLAHKYLQDKTYKNSAWSKLSGLNIKEINHSEKTMLDLLDYQLYVKKDVYLQWINMLQSHLKLNILQPMLLLDQHVSRTSSSNNTFHHSIHQTQSLASAQQSLPSPPLEDSFISHKRKLNHDDDKIAKKHCL